MGKVESAVTDKHEFGCQNISMNQALYGSFRLSKFQCKDQKRKDFLHILPLLKKFFDGVIHGQNQNCSHRET